MHSTVVSAEKTTHLFAQDLLVIKEALPEEKLMQEDLGLRAFVSMVDLNNFRSC